MKKLTVGGSFIGWESIKRLVKAAENHRDKLLILCLFKLGGRTSEVLSLEAKQFDFRASKYSIIVRDMLVLKKYIRLKNAKGKFTGKTQSVPRYRTFPVLKDESFSEELDRIKNMKGLLFHYPFKKNKPISRQLSLHYVKAVGFRAGFIINDHYLRGQRVAQLKSEYGFRGEPLNEWIGWSARPEKGMEMQTHYGSLGWEGLEIELLEGKMRRKQVYEMVKQS